MALRLQGSRCRDICRRLGAMALEADRLAFKAYNRGVLLAEEGVLDGARKAFEEAIRVGDPELAPRAAFNLGVLLAADPAAAVDAYQQAIATGHPDVAPKAAFNLACVLDQDGQPEAARAAYERAIEIGGAEIFAYSVLRLAALPR